MSENTEEILDNCVPSSLIAQDIGKQYAVERGIWPPSRFSAIRSAKTANTTPRVDAGPSIPVP